MFLFLAKYAIGDKLKLLWQFICDHWQAFLLLAMILAILHYKSEYERIKSEYERYQSNIALVTDMQSKLNADMTKKAKESVSEVIKTHDEKLNADNLNHAREAKNLKGKINEINNTLAIYDNAIKLRNSTSADGMSEMAEDTANTTDTRANSDQTATGCENLLNTTIKAAKTTDIDYEALYTLYKRQCDIFGCE